MGNLDEENSDNVLRYIYMLDEHLDNLKLLWQGLSKDSNGKLVRINDPVAPDSFILSAIGSLKSVLNPHNFVSQLKEHEKPHIILDTYKAFLATILKHKFFNWDHFPMVAESCYNTIHLFVNIMVGGFGAQFTLGAQTGITQRIHRDEEKREMRPYMDIPKVFGFDNKNSAQEKQTNNYTESIEPESEYD